RQGISVFDKDMRLICWNRQFREILNLPPELGRVGVPLDEIVRFSANRGDLGPGVAEDIVSDHIHKYAVTQETFQERLGADDAGPVIEVRTNLMPQGGIVTTYTDITERVEAADALSRANETLERRVRERTAELTTVNSELAKAKAKADEANLDKTRFLAAASHDILQPLNAARLYTTSLVERNKRGKDSRLLRNVDASLEAVEDILNALLDISRLDTGAMKPEISVFPVHDLLQQLKLEFAPITEDAGLKLNVLPSSLYVKSDRRLLRRVLQNLISNAIKYTDTGRVLLGCRRQGDQVKVQIHDTGPGIPESKQDLIFEEFQQLDSNSAGTRGLGLGLSIVERIGRVLDHPIDLDSTPGKGSVFSVTLPVADPVRTLAKQPSRRAPVGDIAGTTVLCIDNEPAILDGMDTLLSNWGCSVITATDSRSAVKAVEAKSTVPDIIVADYHLESETGLSAINAIRDFCNFEVPTVIVTADRSPEVQQKVRDIGLQILRKPIRPAALRAVMAQMRIRRAAAE
ncbi:MAG: PAS-domain containing protein, partial [Hyphomicrobiales bacterium]|nr:PAS-domain containing protein [Hyphomicrobiales bacterium]